MKTWIKLYTEILSDPKMGRMNDKLFRRTIELFLLAGKEDKLGKLPSIEDIAWSLHISEKEVQTVLRELEKVGIVSYISDDNGSEKYLIQNFESRQSSDANKSEINRRYYEKSKNKKSEFQTSENLNKTSENLNKMRSKISESDNRQSEIQTVQESEIQTLEEEVEVEVEEDKEVNKLCADAQKRKTSNPDDPAFWQRTFGPRAEMAHAFHVVTGITPIRNEFGRWQNDLKDLQEADITIPEMENAVRQMRAENLTIKAPGSILAMARKLKMNPQPILPQKKKTYSFTEVGEMMKRGELVI